MDESTNPVCSPGTSPATVSSCACEDSGSSEIGFVCAAMSYSSENTPDVTKEVLDVVLVGDELKLLAVVCDEISDGKADTTDTDVCGDVWVDTGAGRTDCVAAVNDWVEGTDVTMDRALSDDGTVDAVVDRTGFIDSTDDTVSSAGCIVLDGTAVTIVVDTVDCTIPNDGTVDAAADTTGCVVS